MTQQIPLSGEASVAAFKTEGGSIEIAPDLAYLRTAIVNLIFFGPPGAGDRGWVLIDAGIIGSKGAIRSAAEARFGAGTRPAAIVMTHGHFDHVGALESLSEEWDAPVFAHSLEMPYLNGTASYPPGDPTVGGGMMALLSPLYPTAPVDVSARLKTLPADGSVPFMPGWRWIHTPGHAPGHVSLWRDSDHTVIVGDAFVTTAQESAYAVAVQAAEMHGPPKYFTIDWPLAKASVARLAALGPELAITGHGLPMQGPAMRDALNNLVANFEARAVPDHGHYVEEPAKAEDGSAYR